MNVLTLIDVFSFEPAGGAGRVMFESAKELARRGHQVTVVCRRRDDLPDQGTIEGVDFVTFKADDTSTCSFFLTCWKQFQSLAKQVLSSWNSRRTLIHTHHAFPLYALNFVPALQRYPVLFTCHSPWHLEYITRNESSSPFLSTDLFKQLFSSFRRYIEQYAAHRADRLVCLSKYMKDQVKNIHHVRDSTFELVPGAANISKFSPEPSDQRETIRKRHGATEQTVVLLTVRALIPRTGIDRLITACGSLFDRHRDIELWIGGTGPKREEFEQLAATAGIRNRTLFLGYLKEEELPSYYRSCDLFVVPTAALEGFGLVIVEALASGTPVLATPVGGIPEILEPFEPDLLFDGKDVSSIRSGLRRAYEQRDRFKELGERGRVYCEQHYSWTKRTDQLESVMIELLETHSVN